MHGDLVAVELLPAREWRGRTTALHEGMAEDKAGDETQSQPMPTGEPGMPAAPPVPTSPTIVILLSLSLELCMLGLYEGKRTITRNKRDSLLEDLPSDITQKIASCIMTPIPIKWCVEPVDSAAKMKKLKKKTP